MRSAAEHQLRPSGRGADLLDHVDYRLAETPEEKDEIYRLRYRAYLREGAIRPSDPSASPIATTSAQRLDLRRLSRRRALQFHPRQRADVGMADVALGRSVRRYLHPELDRGEIIIDPTRFVADPAKASVSGTALCDGAAWLYRVRSLQCRYRLANVRPEHQAFYRRVFLQRPLPSRDCFPGLDQAGRTDGGAIIPRARKVFERLSVSCVPALSSGGCCSSAAAAPLLPRMRFLVRAHLDRPRNPDELVRRAPARPPGVSPRGPLSLLQPLSDQCCRSASERSQKPGTTAAAPACLHPRATFTTH